MQHLVGWAESVDQGGAAADIDAIPDDTLFAQGDIIRVPEGIAMLQGLAFLSAATTFTAAVLQAPSLRTLADFDLLPAERRQSARRRSEHLQRWPGSAITRCR